MIIRLIELQGITKNFGSTRVLGGINMRIDNGSCHCVLGPSGSGKSTLLKIMAMILMPDSGKVLVDGIEVTTADNAQSDKLRERIAYSFQEPLLLPYLSTIENVVDLNSVYSEYPDGFLRETALDFLSRVGLENRTSYPVNRLSVGERKRVDLVRALLRNPGLLIADEPFASLDPDNAHNVVKLIRAASARGVTVVYSTVDPSEANILGDKVTHLRKAEIGSVVELDSEVT